MLSKDQKFTALNIAVEVAKKYAENSSERVTPGMVLEDFFKTYVRLAEEIQDDKS